VAVLSGVLRGDSSILAWMIQGLLFAVITRVDWSVCEVYCPYLRGINGSQWRGIRRYAASKQSGNENKAGEEEAGPTCLTSIIFASTRSTAIFTAPAPVRLPFRYGCNSMYFV